jgi:hypothetical protein
MKSRIATWQSIVLTFVAAVIFYLLAYSWMSKRQTGKGPWQVNFATNSAGTPQIIIGQSALGISNVVVSFEGEQLAATNATGAVAFDKPRKPTPFGRVIYDDLMFQPGAVALDCFGHVIEMVPSRLGLNTKPVTWKSGETFMLWPTNKVPSEVRGKWKGGYRR